MTRTRLLIVAVLAPLAVTGIAAAVAGIVLSDLSRMLFVHWDGAGTADGVAPGWLLFVGFAALGIAIPLLVGLILLEHGDRPLGVQTKIVALVPLFLAAVLGGILVWIAVSQRDAGAPPPEVWGGLLSGFLPALVLAVVGWFALPRAESGPPTPTVPAATAPPLGADERAVWLGRTSLSPRARTAIGVLVLVLLAALVAANAVTGGALWGLLAIPAVLVVLFALTASWTVRADRSGLLVRSVLGWPR